MLRLFRNAGARVTVLEAAILAYCFLAAAFHSDDLPVAQDPVALLRLALAVAAALLGLLLRDVLARGEERAPHAAALDVVAAFGCVLSAELLLVVVAPGLVLPRWAPTQGGFVGISLLALSRALYPNLPQVIAIREPVYRRVHWLAALVSAGVAVIALRSTEVQFRMAAGVLIAGDLFLLWDARRRRAWPWYYVSLVPAMLISLAGAQAYLYWAPVLALMVAEVEVRLSVEVSVPVNS